MNKINDQKPSKKAWSDLNCDFRYRSLIFIGKSGESTRGPLVSSSEKESVLYTVLFAFNNAVLYYRVRHQT